MDINVEININGELSISTSLSDNEIQDLIMYVNRLIDTHKNIIEEESDKQC